MYAINIAVENIQHATHGKISYYLVSERDDAKKRRIKRYKSREVGTIGGMDGRCDMSHKCLILEGLLVPIIITI